MPPATIAAPSTSSTLPMIDPVIDALTTPTSPCDNAISAMINSAALPNVAFSRPPMPGPARAPRCSVARPIQPAQWNDGEPGDEERTVSFLQAGTHRIASATGTAIKR